MAKPSWQKKGPFLIWADKMRPFGWGLIFGATFIMWTAPVEQAYVGGLGFIPVFIGLLIALHGDLDD